jgi:hypothetical protein
MVMSQQVSSSSRALSLTIAVHASLMFIGFFGLVAVFDFPDIPREPPPVILETFRSSRTLVQGFYAAFMWSQVAFVCVVLALRERFGEPTPLLRASTQPFVLVDRTCGERGAPAAPATLGDWSPDYPVGAHRVRLGVFIS